MAQLRHEIAHQPRFSPERLRIEAKKEKRKERVLTFCIYAFLILASLPLIIGYGWLVLNSFSETLAYGVLPKGWTIKNFRFLWELPSRYYPDLWRTTWNTLLLAVGMTVIMILVATPTAYVISRMKFPGRNMMLAMTLILHSFPGVTLLISLYYVLRSLNLLNSIVGVFLVKAGLMLPLGIWIMKGFFDNVSWDVEMSGLVDGATRLQTLYKIVLPQVKPGIAAMAIFSFINGWSEYIYVITFIQKKESWTLSSYVNSIIGDFQFIDYGLLSATALFYILPVLLFFIFTQKYLMTVTVGGTKG
ncbi:MAG: carbohydrate ABC transporter permease [Bacillota bacterium]|jgi:inositol-phosphate transport system permease protein|nr:carbohydrate ABC transporter permease [Bacillota bacterium]